MAAPDIKIAADPTAIANEILRMIPTSRNIVLKAKSSLGLK
jgi:hypothetical protein